MNEANISLTVIVPFTERYDDPKELYWDYKEGVKACGQAFEFIYVLDGSFPSVAQALHELKEQGEPITIIKMAKWFGEAAVLNIACDYAKADLILTLPAYYQIQPDAIADFVSQMGKSDLLVARRFPRIDSKINQFQNRLFHRTLRLLTGQAFYDIGCGVRLMQRRVLEELNIYGDQHRFLPLLAYQKGFKVVEVPVRQSKRDAQTRIYRPGVYIRRFLDLLTIFFLVKFTKKPLRFFGLLGSTVFVAGLLSTLYLILDRLVFGVPLADRPAVLLSSLLIVLGIQIFAIGLIGEIIIFTHAKDIKEYTIEEIIN